MRVVTDCGGGIEPPWACCSDTVEAYFLRLQLARQQGWLNRTVFCYGWMLARSQWNPSGWTAAQLRSDMLKVKRQFPELRGIAFYGHASHC